MSSLLHTRLTLFFTFGIFFANAQQDTVKVGEKVITLSEVVVQKNLDVPAFIELIKNDTSFYKAFRNLRILQFSAINDIRMNNSKGKPLATLRSKTNQVRKNGCRQTFVTEADTTGNMFASSGDYNYYTARMYASLFFAPQPVCGENNIVAGSEFSTQDKKGLEKHKEQLKMLFFNPGRRISGIPFISNKTAIYSDDLADDYTMHIALEEFNGKNCYVFRQKVRRGRESKVVVNEMNTWFNADDMRIEGRNYSLSYKAGIYDFDVSMEVIMEQFEDLTVPRLIRYVGDWKAITRKRERGVFTAILYGFSRPGDGL